MIQHTSVDPSLSLETLLTNFSIIILAVGAVIAGLYKGWAEIKKSIRESADADPGQPVAPVPVMATNEIDLAGITREVEQLKDEIVDLRRCTSDHTHELRENRRAIVETSHSMTKLVEALTNFNR